MIKTILHTHWGFMRWIRLALGLYLVFIAFTESDLLAGGIGALLTFLALFNQGCGGGSCTVPRK